MIKISILVCKMSWDSVLKDSVFIVYRVFKKFWIKMGDDYVIIFFKVVCSVRFIS